MYARFERHKLPSMKTEDGLEIKLCKEIPEVFSDKLGACKQPIRLQLSDKEPVYVRVGPVPLDLRLRVEREIERLQADATRRFYLSS